MAATPTSEKIKLYSVPVSNFAARCRLLVYWQGLEASFHEFTTYQEICAPKKYFIVSFLICLKFAQDRVEIVAPAELGGLKSPQYLALNPQGKMPLLVLPSGDALFESEVISQYLLDKFPSGGMEAPPTPEARARAALLTRVHDIYMGPIQACLYRDMDILVRARCQRP